MDAVGEDILIPSNETHTFAIQPLGRSEFNEIDYRFYGRVDALGSFSVYLVKFDEDEYIPPPNELFVGQSMISLHYMSKARIIFSEDFLFKSPSAYNRRNSIEIPYNLNFNKGKVVLYVFSYNQNVRLNYVIRCLDPTDKYRNKTSDCRRYGEGNEYVIVMFSNESSCNYFGTWEY